MLQMRLSTSVIRVQVTQVWLFEEQDEQSEHSRDFPGFPSLPAVHAR